MTQRKRLTTIIFIYYWIITTSMDSNIKLAQKHGLVGKVLLYFGANTYYPESVTEFNGDCDEVQFTDRRGPMGYLYNGMALVKLNSCFYTPKSNGVGILSDLNSELEVDVVKFSENLPQDRKHVKNILLELKEGKDLPSLIKYG